ncbi:hypothetical protein MMC20_002201 [Loxospora ochrophaea]|nr:hypothetical protein [Loxospora ochrophaea]
MANIEAPTDTVLLANGDVDTEIPPPAHSPYAPDTLAIHADDYLNRVPDVAPPLHVATTFRYADDPDKLVPARELDSHPTDQHIYSRHTAPTTTRLEALLTPLLHAPSLTYSSGLSALFALYTYLRPTRVAISGGYHGTHAVLSLHSKLTGLQLLPLTTPATTLHPGDIIHLETPLNPSGEALNIAFFADIAHSRGAYLVVDATFGPPGLQEPFALGADVVMHSGTKYLGGHSDLLCGVVATRKEEWVRGLKEERAVLGSVMGGMEGWLGVRSLRTLGVRVQRMSVGAEKLVGWLSGLLDHDDDGDDDDDETGEQRRIVRRVVARVQHASLQRADLLPPVGAPPGTPSWLRRQMPHGFGGVFALTMKSEALARRLPSKLHLFAHATSLGGVESLIEWRAMSDKGVDGRLLRVSVGIEDWEDLRGDLLRGCREVAGKEEEGKE